MWVMSLDQRVCLEYSSSGQRMRNNMPDQLVNDSDHVQLCRLVTEIAWRIDHGQANTVWELFVPSGILNTSGNPLVGHDAIRAWGAERVRATTLSRHICSGMRFVRNGPDKAIGSTLLTIFMGQAGSVGSSNPQIVGEDRDEFVRTPEGWKFTSRTFETLFVSS